MVDLQRAGHFLDLALDIGADLLLPRHKIADDGKALRRRQAPHGERHSDIFSGGQVRIEGIGLKHHRDIAIGRSLAHDAACTDDDLAGIAVIKPGHDSKKRALAAAGRTDKRDEFAHFGLQADAFQDGVAAIGFGDAAQRKHAHCAASTLSFFLAASG
ncbi:hypothetical protein D9M72_433050 [compost metagenome]